MEEIEKRLKSVESGFVIVANDVVGKIEEVHRDVRELGRESRDTFREIRDIRQDMRASFGLASQELLRIENKLDSMATKDDLGEVEARMNTRMNLLASKMDQVIDLLTKPQK